MLKHSLAAGITGAYLGALQERDRQRTASISGGQNLKSENAYVPFDYGKITGAALSNSVKYAISARLHTTLELFECHH